MHRYSLKFAQLYDSASVVFDLHHCQIHNGVVIFSLKEVKDLKYEAFFNFPRIFCSCSELP